MTPHNEAAVGDYAPTVLLSGDPLRTEWIAATMLEDVRCVNRIRGALGYTGSYRGLPVSVQTTGIGSPSLAIYVHELLEFYGVRTLFRVGTCGGLQDKVRIRDVVVSVSVVSDENGGYDEYSAGTSPLPSPDPHLLETAIEEVERARGAHHVGPTASSDFFYHPRGRDRFIPLRTHGVLAVDMETCALYTLATRFGARALSICTVVDNIFTGHAIAEAERQGVFRPMAGLALEIALRSGSQA